MANLIDWIQGEGQQFMDQASQIPPPLGGPTLLNFLQGVRETNKANFDTSRGPSHTRNKGVQEQPPTTLNPTKPKGNPNDPNFRGWFKQPDGSLEYKDPNNVPYNPDNWLGMTESQFEDEKKYRSEEGWRDKFAQSDDERVQNLAKKGQKGTAEDTYSWINSLSGGELQAPSKNLNDSFTIIYQKSGLKPSMEVMQEFRKVAPGMAQQWLAAAPPEEQNAQGYYTAMTQLLENLIKLESGETTTESTTESSSGAGTATSSGAPDIVAATGVRNADTIRQQQELNAQWETMTDEQKAQFTAQLASQPYDEEEGGEPVTPGMHNFDNMIGPKVVGGPTMQGDFGEAPLAKIVKAIFGR